MGNTFGSNGFSVGSKTHVSTEVAQIMVRKADRPDVDVDFFDADPLDRRKT